MMLELSDGLFLNLDKVLFIEEVGEDRLGALSDHVYSRLLDFAPNYSEPMVGAGSLDTNVRQTRPAWMSNGRDVPFVVVMFETHSCLYFEGRDADILRAYLDQHRG